MNEKTGYPEFFQPTIPIRSRTFPRITELMPYAVNNLFKFTVLWLCEVEHL